MPRPKAEPPFLGVWQLHHTVLVLTLGISERQVFALIRRLGMAKGDPAAVLLRTSSGRRDLPRITPAAEQMAQDLINGVLQNTPNKRVPELLPRFKNLALSSR